MQPAIIRIGAYAWSSFDSLRASGGRGQVKPAPVGLAAADSAAIAQDNGDRVQLPGEVLMRIDQLCGGDEWPASPMIFQIRNPATNARVYAGCLDFLGSGIGLPASVVESLGLTSVSERGAPRLEVSLVHDRSKGGKCGGGLPKARAIKVQPLSSDFAADCPDPVRLLERLLPANFTALYAGQVITLRHVGASYRLLVSEVEPADAPAAIIIDTDVRLELLPALGAPALTYLRPSIPVAGSLRLRLGKPRSADASAQAGAGAGAGGGEGDGEGGQSSGPVAYFSFAYPPGVHPASIVPRITLDSRPVSASASASGVAGSAASPPVFARADAFVSLFPHRKPGLLAHHWALLTVGAGPSASAAAGADAGTAGAGTGGASLILLPETESLVPGEKPRTQRPGAGFTAGAAVQAHGAAPPADVVGAAGAAAVAEPGAAAGSAAAVPAPAPVAFASAADGIAAPGKRLTTADLVARVRAMKAAEAAAAAAAAAAGGAAGGAGAGAGAGAAPAAPTGDATPLPLPSTVKLAPPPSYYVGVTIAAPPAPPSPAPVRAGAGAGGEPGDAAECAFGCDFSLRVDFIPAAEADAALAAGAAAAAASGGAMSTASAIRAAGFTGSVDLMRVSSAPMEETAAPVIVGAGDTSGAGAVPADRKLCANCGAAVAASNYALHAAQCARNNMRCPHPGCGAVLRKGPAALDNHWHCPEAGCGRVMPAAVGPKHVNLYHEPVSCEHGCGARLPVPQLRAHVRDACERRIVECRFCKNRTRAGAPPDEAGDAALGLTRHEAYCGSRRTACGVCGSRLPLKEHEGHYAASHPGVAFKGVAYEPDPLHVEAGGAAAAEAAAAAAAEDWACPACTLLNAAGNKRCDVCDTARPALVPAAAAAPAAAPPAPVAVAPAPAVVSAPAPALVYPCRQCTYEHGAWQVNCDVCGGPLRREDGKRPEPEPELEPAAVAAAQVTPVPAAVAELDALTPEHDYAGVGAGAGAAPPRRPMLAPAAAPSSGPRSGSGSSGFPRHLARLCRNQVCASAAASEGAAGELSLCATCYSSFGCVQGSAGAGAGAAGDAMEEEEEEAAAGEGAFTDAGSIEAAQAEIAQALAARYGAQLAHGCARADCRNPHCSTGRGNAAAAAGAAMAPVPAPRSLAHAGTSVVGAEMAALLSAAAGQKIADHEAALADHSASLTGTAPRYWVCAPPGAPQRRVVRAVERQV